MDRLFGHGTLHWELPDAMVAVTAVAGRGLLRLAQHEITIRCGQSLVIPASVDAIELTGAGVELIASYVDASHHA